MHYDTFDNGHKEMSQERSQITGDSQTLESIEGVQMANQIIYRDLINSPKDLTRLQIDKQQSQDGTGEQGRNRNQPGSQARAKAAKLDAAEFEDIKQKYMREKGIKAGKLDEEEWDALKQAYLQKKAVKPEKLDDAEYEYLKQQYIKDKGIKELSMEAEDYET